MPKAGRCPVTGKVRWPDGKSAVEMLHSARNAATRASALGFESRRREVRHYFCPSCKGFHTTSQSLAVAVSV